MTDDLIEAVARAICAEIGPRLWDDVPADRGDLRYRVRSGKEYDVNEPTRMDYLNAAQEAIRAAAPLILDMAADVVIGYIHPDPERLPGEMFATAQVRQLKERFQ